MPNNTYNGYTCTNHGGISVGTANNRLFTVKSHSGEEYATLYYYSNIYSGNAPKEIVFADGLLGHANAMAIDDLNVYVTQWQKQSGGEKSRVIQISRRAISRLANNAVVSLTNNTFIDSDNTVKPVYHIYTPKKTNGTNYTASIASITRYSYNSSTQVTKFIIGHGKTATQVSNGYNYVNSFAIATLNSATGTFVVSEDSANTFSVAYHDDSSVAATFQDMFYDAQYGLIFPYWLNNSLNRVVRVDIRNFAQASGNLTPADILTINKTSTDSGEPLLKYEIESIAFVKHDANNQQDAFKMVFSTNAQKNPSGMRDSIEMIDPISDYLAPVSTL